MTKDNSLERARDETHSEKLDAMLDSGGCAETWAVAQSYRERSQTGDCSSEAAGGQSSDITRRSVIKNAAQFGIAGLGVSQLPSVAAATPAEPPAQSVSEVEERFAALTADLRTVLADEGVLRTADADQFALDQALERRAIGPDVDAEGVRVTRTTTGDYRFGVSHNTDDYRLAVFATHLAENAHAVVETGDETLLVTSDGAESSDDFCWTNQYCNWDSCWCNDGSFPVNYGRKVRERCCWDGWFGFTCRVEWEGDCYDCIDDSIGGCP